MGILKKNRYQNILPFDETRVILNDENNDYINANWCSYNGNSKEYICAQGPMENTVEDYWRMIFENNVFIVIMLTRLREDDREKCFKYWPDENDVEKFGDFEIASLSVENNESLVSRKFKLTYGDVEKEIVHYQYTAWPDHGIPGSEEEFITLINEIELIKNDDNNPLLIHCSAGVGRSGTFCTVYSIIKNMRESTRDHSRLPDINIVETVLNFRKQRQGMIQTKEQYTLCYQVIYHEFKKLENQLQDSE